MLPPSYVPVDDDENTKQESESRFLRFSKALDDGESLLLRLCGNYLSGHGIFGYFYFDLEGKPHHSVDYPEDYEDSIGFSFDAKKKAAIQGRELDIRRDERDVPKRFAALTAIVHKCPSGKESQSYDEGRLVIADFTQVKLLKMIEGLFNEEEYFIEDNEPASYVLRVTKTMKKGKTDYDCLPLTKRVAPAEKTLWVEEGREKIYVPAIFNSGDPFEGRPADGVMPSAAPSKSREADDLGADKEWN
jgi:hypothetical protein